MSSLAEIETALPTLSAEELAELERALQDEKRHRSVSASPSSALDLPPLDLGESLKPFVRDDELFDEMLR